MANETGPIQAGTARRLLLWGTGVSVAYLAALGGYAWNEVAHMRAMSPDEFATFLSGAFAPLAFLWLVLGFKQQGDELQNSARALWLQGEELRNSVEQQRQLVEVSRDQLAADYKKRMEDEQEMDRVSQPRLHFSDFGGVFQGPRRAYTVRIGNAGPTCGDLVIFANGVQVGTRAVFAGGETTAFELAYATPDDVEPLDIVFQYTDARHNRREQAFRITVAETGGPNGDRSLDRAIRIADARPVEPPA